VAVAAAVATALALLLRGLPTLRSEFGVVSILNVLARRGGVFVGVAFAFFEAEVDLLTLFVEEARLTGVVKTSSILNSDLIDLLLVNGPVNGVVLEDEGED